MSAVLDSRCFPSSLTTTGYIRLLKLQQDRQDGSIACTLETVRLRDNPHYLALSYTWGPPKAVAPGTGLLLGHEESPWILCNEAVVKITRNLHDFLQRAYSEPGLCSQRFWIDSICINQLDAQERCAQVGSMASIYRSADCVVAWLGEEEADTETAFALITKLANLSQDLLAKVIPKNRQSPDFKKILGPLADDVAWEALRQFWRRSYFTRAWIIQELVLARKSIIRCGRHVVDWNFVVRTSKFLTTTAWSRLFNSGVHDPTDPEYSHHAQPLYIHVNSKMSSANSDRSLLYAIIRARRFVSTDPRDKVYALLGLDEDYVRGKPRLLPVYGDRSAAETYISAAVQMLEDADDLLLLAQVEGQDFQTLPNLPSWVPDWSCAKGLGLGIVGYERFSAAGDAPRNLTIKETERQLLLHGVLLDCVLQIGESKEEAGIHKETGCHHFPGWLSILSALPSIYHTGQRRSEVLWRTLITDTASRIPLPSRHPAAGEYGLAFRDWLAQIILSLKESEPISAERAQFLDGLRGLEAELAQQEPKGSCDIPDSLNRLERTPDADNYGTILNFSFQTRLLMTARGYLGIATTSVRVGDLVWIVPGSRVPLIFRATRPPNGYRLVGGAYIHGFMQGEALKSHSIFSTIVVT